MVAYHVTLGGQGLVLDLGSYRRRSARRYASKEAQGARSYDDELLEQVLTLGDWSGGEGQLDQVASDRYRSGSGLDGFTTPGQLQVGPNLNTSYSSSVNALRLFVAYKGKLLAGDGDGKVFEESATDTWAQDRDLAKAAGITAFAIGSDGSTRNILYVGNGTDNVVSKYDGTTWTNSFGTMTNLTRTTGGITFPLDGGGAADLRAVFTGPTSSGSALYQVSSATPSQQVTFHDQDFGHLVELDGSIWGWGFDSTAKRSRLYRLYYNGSIIAADSVFVHEDSYPTVAAAFGGAVYVGMANGQLWRYTPSSEAWELLRSDLSASGDPLYGLATWRGALWVSGRSGSEILLKRFDGSAWSEPVKGGSLDSSAGSARALIAFNGDLYACGEKSGASPIYRCRQGVYATAAKSLQTSLEAAGLVDVQKVFRSVTIAHAALAASQSIQVEYQLEDSGAWTSLGTNSTLGSTTATYSFSGTVTGRVIALRLTLTATSSTTPALYEVLLRYALAPADKREWEFEALAEGTAELPLITVDQTAGPQTGAAISAALWALYTASPKVPVTFVDLDSASRTVYLLELEEKISPRSQREGSHFRSKLRLVEA